MDYRQLGHSGVRVSIIGLGANRFGSSDVPQAEVDKIIDAALDAGINFIDTADVYNDGASEETLGHALKSRFHRVVMSTKFNFPRKTGARFSIVRPGSTKPPAGSSSRTIICWSATFLPKISAKPASSFSLSNAPCSSTKNCSGGIS